MTVECSALEETSFTTPNPKDPKSIVGGGTERIKEPEDGKGCCKRRSVALMNSGQLWLPVQDQANKISQHYSRQTDIDTRKKGRKREKEGRGERERKGRGRERRGKGGRSEKRKEKRKQRKNRECEEGTC